MLNLWVIAMLASIVWRDSLARPLADGLCTRLDVMLVVVLSAVSICLAVRVVTTRAAARIDATGSAVAVIAAERAVKYGRWGIVLVHGVGVIALGWLDAVRDAIGNLVVVDELVCMSPCLFVFAAGWWCLHPIEARLQDAATYRLLHEGAAGSAYYPVPTRWRFVWLQFRHGVLLTLLPLVLLVAWSEVLERVVQAIKAWAVHESGEHSASLLSMRAREILSREDAISVVEFGLHVLGVLAVFLFAPAALRRVCCTAPLPAGGLRDGLVALCRSQRIKVREILVWRTYGTMMNAAVIGVLAPLRYVLITDVLLDSMPTRELEAAMAHELGHVKHRHLVWLMFTLAVTLGVLAGVFEMVVPRALPAMSWSGGDEVRLFTLAASLAIGIRVISLVSRRFEWQADAFAARCLSHETSALVERAESDTPAERVTEVGAGAMIRTLELLTVIGNASAEAPSLLHGSIKARTDRLRSIIGTPVDNVPIDRVVRRIKRVVWLVALVGVLFALRGLIGGLLV